MTRARTVGFGVLGLGIGCLLWYTRHSGLAIPLVLVLMWTGTLLSSPSIDLLRHRKVHRCPTVATGLCLHNDGDVAAPLARGRPSCVDSARQLWVLVRRGIGEVGVQRGPVVASGG